MRQTILINARRRGTLFRSYFRPRLNTDLYVYQLIIAAQCDFASLREGAIRAKAPSTLGRKTENDSPTHCLASIVTSLCKNLLQRTIWVWPNLCVSPTLAR